MCADLFKSPPTGISRQGYTLMELSIVISIIGLLVGAVMGGQMLVRASQLRSVTSQQQKILTAINSFKEKYRYLPGDIPNATQFWGIAGGNGNNAPCTTTPSTTTATCNGDGDGSIRSLIPGPETLRIWQHLSNAGLLEGQYTGAYISGGQTPATSPSGKIASSLWLTFDYSNQTGSNTIFFNGSYGNSMVIGGETPSDQPKTAIMTNLELWDLDTKTDDGLPATGKIVIIAYDGFSTCTTTADGATSTLTGTYLGNEEKKCLPVWRKQF